MKKKKEVLYSKKFCQTFCFGQWVVEVTPTALKSGVGAEFDRGTETLKKAYCVPECTLCVCILLLWTALVCEEMSEEL